jgi:hypothetical protein
MKHHNQIAVDATHNNKMSLFKKIHREEVESKTDKVFGETCFLGKERRRAQEKEEALMPIKRKNTL